MIRAAGLLVCSLLICTRATIAQPPPPEVPRYVERNFYNEVGTTPNPIADHCLLDPDTTDPEQDFVSVLAETQFQQDGRLGPYNNPIGDWGEARGGAWAEKRQKWEWVDLDTDQLPDHKAFAYQVVTDGFGDGSAYNGQAYGSASYGISASIVDWAEDPENNPVNCGGTSGYLAGVSVQNSTDYDTGGSQNRGGTLKADGSEVTLNWPKMEARLKGTLWAEIWGTMNNTGDVSLSVYGSLGHNYLVLNPPID